MLIRPWSIGRSPASARRIVDLPGAVRSEDGDHLTGFDSEFDVEVEGAELQADARVEAHPAPGAGVPPSHRSRRPTSTANDTAISTRLRINASSGFDSNARYVASGIVWVVPGKLPANVIVAPNSPRARAQASTAPAINAGRTVGSVTRRNTYQRDPPNVRAASS